MCAVSAVFDYYRVRPEIKWSPDDYERLQRIIEELKILDEHQDQPDCEDSEKAAWMRDVEERLKRLERGTD